MITVEQFCEQISAHGISFVTGVPCSYLSGPIEWLTRAGTYVPAVNEGAAVGLACGAAAAGRRAAVISQNSGLGNMINPLTSLQATYRIPLLTFLSLRGWPDPGQDEPQHAIMGTATRRLLDGIGAKHWTLEPSARSLADVLARADEELAADRSAFILVPKGSVAGKERPQPPPATAMTRAEAIVVLLDRLGERSFVSTTGYASRYLFALRDRAENFYMQGSMGHAGAFALGLAMHQPGRGVVVLDGDGAALMHLGTLSTIGSVGPVDLVHVVLDNGAYASTGLQATTSSTTDLAQVAAAAGYATAVRCDTVDRLHLALSEIAGRPGPHMIVAAVAADSGTTPPRATAAIQAPEIYRRFSATLDRPRSVPGDAYRMPLGSRRRIDMGEGTLRALRVALDQARRPMVVASQARLKAVGLEHLLDERVAVYSHFTPNPTLDQALAGCALRDEVRPDLIVGLGGGSAMDVAKAVRLLPADAREARKFLASPEQPDDVIPLMLVATTAGTGSEVTRFATLFDGYRKLSLDHPAVAAEHVVVDPRVTADCPLPVTSSSALDCLSHAVESLWNTSSTVASRSNARTALRLLGGVLSRPLDDLGPADREVLSSASLYAGSAIDVTRTTAAHAFAYHLTARYDVPHGVACVLNLIWLYDYNRLVDDSTCRDPRGAGFVRTRLAEAAADLGTTPDRMVSTLTALLERSQWPARLGDYGVGGSDIGDLVSAGLGYSTRSEKNPMALDRGRIEDHLTRRL